MLGLNMAFSEARKVGCEVPSCRVIPLAIKLCSLSAYVPIPLVYSLFCFPAMIGRLLCSMGITYRSTPGCVV